MKELKIIHTMTNVVDIRPAGNSTYKELVIQWLIKALRYVSSLLMADSFALQNLQLLKPANIWMHM